MEKLSTSQMRQNGLTAFEAELVNYILANEITEGTTFHGVPGHPRYGASKEEELVVVFNTETLSVERVGKKVITINFADYTQGRKKASTNTTTTSNNTNNNNNNNSNNMEDMNTTTATPQNITAAAVVRALAQSLTLAATYGAQRTAAALRAAHRATIAARVWLRSSHEFYAQDGDPIKCTGWQFIAYNIAAVVVSVLLSIKY